MCLALLALLSTTFSSHAAYLRADFNLDGTVDTNDLALWQANQGRVSSVPRPETVLTPSLRVTPDRRTVLSGENITLAASGGTSTVHWAFVKNPAGGNLTATTGVSVAYVAGNTSSNVDIIQAWDADNLLTRTFMNVISASEVASLGKAIIVAGGKSLDDPVWLATDYVSDKAFNVLRYRGFSRENIQYLSFDPEQDADGNGLLDDIDYSSAFTNVAETFTNWVGNASQLFVYLADHGSDASGQGYFRLNGTEILSATNLDTWLDGLQDTYGMDIIVVMDFCYSGSFVDELSYGGPASRIVLASASSNELTYFIAGGAVSFSDSFWSGILQGLDVKGSYDLASVSMDSFQQSVIEDGAGGSNTVGRFVGATFIAGKDYPIIGSVLGVQLLSEGTTATLWADDIESYYPVERVWCTIIPPSHNPNTNNGIPVVNIPEIDLVYDNTLGRFQNSFSGFSEQGTYKVNFYAQDIWGSVSPPKPTSVIQAGVDERLILVSAGTTNDANWANRDSMARTVYQTFIARQLTPERIFYMTAVTNQDVTGDGSNDVDNLVTLANFNFAFTNWATNASVTTVYLIGSDTNAEFRLNSTQSISAAFLDTVLDVFQSTSRTVNVVMEFPNSGNYVSQLVPPAGKERISIASAKAGQTNVTESSGLLSFTGHFMSHVVSGRKIGDAYKLARSSIRLASGAVRQTAQLDDDGDGIPDEKNVDGLIAVNRYFGAAFVTGDDAPSIGSVVSNIIIGTSTSVVLWAKDVLDVNGISNVWAIITPPSFSGGPLPQTNLTYNPVNSRYEIVYDELSETGTYAVTFYAQDTQGNISPPYQTLMFDADAFEVDDTAEIASIMEVGDTQTNHNFHTETDEDWIRFYAVSGQVYEITAEQQGENIDLALDLYFEESDGSLTPVDLGVDLFGSGIGEFEQTSVLSNAPSGFYLIRVFSADSNLFGADSDYDVTINVPVGGGNLIVIAVNKLNSAVAISGSSVQIDGGTASNFVSANNLSFVNIAAGTRNVKVNVPAGFYPEEDPAASNQAQNVNNITYGNPRNKGVANDAWQTVTFQFVPMTRASGQVRDQITGEWLSGVKLSFRATSGIISNIIYDGYPNSAVYENLWFSSTNGSFPTNVVLPTVNYNLTLSKAGYSNAVFNGVIASPAVNSIQSLGVRYMTPVDTNGNGIADSWENSYFGGSNVVANEDADNDGVNNRDEYRTGTIPTNSASVLEVDSILNANGFILTWPVAQGRAYRAVGIDSLISNNWSVVGGPWTAAVGQSSMVYTNPTVATGRYHRVEALVP
jgi:Peptidase C13 family